MRLRLGLDDATYEVLVKSLDERRLRTASERQVFSTPNAAKTQIRPAVWWSLATLYQDRPVFVIIGILAVCGTLITLLIKLLQIVRASLS